MLRQILKVRNGVLKDKSKRMGKSPLWKHSNIVEGN